MGKLLPAEAGFGFAELRFAPVRRGVYPAQRDSSTFLPAGGQGSDSNPEHLTI